MIALSSSSIIFFADIKKIIIYSYWNYLYVRKAHHSIAVEFFDLNLSPFKTVWHQSAVPKCRHPPWTKTTIITARKPLLDLHNLKERSQLLCRRNNNLAFERAWEPCPGPSQNNLHKEIRSGNNSNSNIVVSILRQTKWSNSNKVWIHPRPAQIMK